MSASIARRQTCTIIGSPQMSASGLPGKRMEAMRAGMRTTGLTIRDRESQAGSGLIRVAKSRAKRLINPEPRPPHASADPQTFRRKQIPMLEADFNKTALAALGSILFAMLLVAFSNLVFAPQRPAVPGYALPTSAAPSEAPAAAAAPPEEPLPAL